MRINVLGVGFDNVTMDQAVAEGVRLADTEGAHYVVTPNPEIVEACREDQEAHGALGMERRERFRYLGPVRTPLDLGTVVEWKGRQLRVSSVQLVGEGVCPHWRAVLYPRDEVMG